MSKKTKQKKYDFDRLRNERIHYQGIGYYIPECFDKEKVLELYKTWKKKLKDSGFKDIERTSSLCPGLSSPVTFKNKRILSRNTENYQIGHYYDLIAEYYHSYLDTPEAAARYGKLHKTYLIMVDMYKDGKEYLTIAKALRERSTFEKFMKNRVTKVLNSTYGTITKLAAPHKKRSKYWAYIHIRRIMNHCWIWHLTNPTGTLTLKELQHYDFIGLDIPGTAEYLSSLFNTEVSFPFPEIMLDRMASKVQKLTPSELELFKQYRLIKPE